MTTQHLSPTYSEALSALTSAEADFWEASLREAERLIPGGVRALLFRVNDTPRLAFDAYLDEAGAEHEAEGIDDACSTPGLFDALDEIAVQLNVHDAEDASAWLLSYGRERFIIERTP